MRLRAFPPIAAAWLLVLPAPLWAHIDPAGVGAGGLLSGLRHPLTGLDHVGAMVAVGLWGAQLGAPAMWLLPVAFPLIMAVGGILGVVGLPLPAVEPGVAASAVVLGALIVGEVRLPLWSSLPIIAVFAIYHGHAHGTVLPDFGVPILFATGFVASTGLLHLCGILIGLLLLVPRGRWVVRGAGGVVVLVGLYFLVRYLSA